MESLPQHRPIRFQNSAFAFAESFPHRTMMPQSRMLIKMTITLLDWLKKAGDVA